MIRALAPIAVAAGATSCTIGAGSAFVGQWKPRVEHAFVACLEDAQGACRETKAVDVPVPGRRFWGYMISFPMMGLTVGDDGPAFRLDASNEFVRGYGRVAWGVRASVLYDVGQQLSLNVMGLGYLSLTDRIALRAGAGPSPYTHDADSGEDVYTGVRGLLGMQLALNRTHAENYLVLSLDVDRMYVPFAEPRGSTSITSSIGVFF